jgi:cobalt-zinc-cadmium resistance protein CzcA
MEKKSLEDWFLEKSFKGVQGVVDVSSFGGPTKEYQIKLDPEKLVSYGLSIGQVEQQIAANNTNGGGSFIEQGAQQINVQSVGLFSTVQDIENTVVKTQNGAAIKIKDIATVAQGPKIRLGQIGRATHRPDGTIVDNPDTVEGIVLLQKGDDSDPVLLGIHKEVKNLNEHILPKGVKIVPFLDRSDLVSYTVETVEHNLTEGMILVTIILFLFLGNVRGAIIVALTIPFALMFASICLDLSHIPANLLSLGALDFGMVVDGSVIMIENMVRHLSLKDDTRTSAQKIRDAAHEVLRPVFFARGIIITSYLPIFTLQAVEGRLFKPHGLDRLLRPHRRGYLRHCRGSGNGQLPFPQGRQRVAQPHHGVAHVPLSHRGSRRNRASQRHARHLRRSVCHCHLSHRWRTHRLGVPAPPRRRFHLGARNPAAQ